jgi:DNA-binding transcriptional ArsR family regulator
MNDADPLLTALRNPLRAEAFRIIARGSTSPAMIAAELDEPIGNVAYHVRVLDRLGLIRLHRTKPRRGALEHFYVVADKDRPVLAGKLRELADELDGGA